MFIENPNLPKDAETVILGSKYAKILDKPLLNIGLKPIYIPDNPNVDSRLCGHADLSVFHAGGKKLFLAPYLKDSEFERKIKNLGFESNICNVMQGKKYPYDAQLNLCAIGNTLIYSKNVSYSRIASYLTSNSQVRAINSKQGYARCSICVVDSNSIITADRGVYSACKNAKMDVLLISQGYVSLPGFDYGFLGGSAFKLAENTLAFTGFLDSHPDRERILEFLKLKNVEPVFLTDYPIFDIGSVIPITEKARA